MAGEPGVHHELVLVDQAQLGQGQPEPHAAHAQSLARLLLEPMDGLPQIPAQQLSVPIDPGQGARYDELLRGVDGPGEGVHPVRPRARRRRRPPARFHQLVGHPAQEQRVSPEDGLDRMEMQVLVRDHLAVITAPVQGDVDGIPERSHDGRTQMALGSLGLGLSEALGDIGEVDGGVHGNKKLSGPAQSGLLERRVKLLMNHDCGLNKLDRVQGQIGMLE